MRLFEFPVGAKMYPHRHSWEHEIYTLEGQGRITVGEEPIDVQPGDALYVAPDIIHGYEIQETACGNSSASFQNEISFYGSALANLISFQAVPQCVEVTGFLQVASL